MRRRQSKVMRLVGFAVGAALVACYQPSPPEGAPCSSRGECPSSLVCDRGTCVRVPGSDASAPDVPADGDLVFDVPVDVAVDAPIDAPPTDVITFGPGNDVYTVPLGCTRIRVRAWGGGGGGGGDLTSATDGSPGGDTVFDGTIHAGGGGGGSQGNPAGTYLGGAGGSAGGAATSITGQTGGSGNAAQEVGTSGAGGASPMGGSGGPSISTANTAGNPGDTPGGGGSGAQGNFSPAAGGGGGGYGESLLDVTPGEMFTVEVGIGGPGGLGTHRGGAGAPGRITVQCQ